MADKAPAPAGGKKKMLIVLLVVAVCSAGSGFMLPRFLHSKPPEDRAGKEAPPKEVFMPFGEVTVNLSEGRLSRYLRVKLVLVTDDRHDKKVQERLEARKAALRNWLIAHLSDKAVSDVQGRASINRIRREILEQFNGSLVPEGPGPLHDVLFEEFMVQ